MNVVFPVPYLDRLEPGGDGLGIRFDDPIEHDVPEISVADAPIVISARTSFFNEEDQVDWRSVDLRINDGKLLRSALRKGLSNFPMSRENLPERIGGRVDWKTGQHAGLLPGSRDIYLNNAVSALSIGQPGTTRIKRSLSKSLLVEWGRERMRELTQRALERLVIVDGQVWKSTNWPKIWIAQDFDGILTHIDFTEEDEFVSPRYHRPQYGDRLLLFSHYPRIQEIAEEARVPLADRYQVVVDYIDEEALPCQNERLNEAIRIAGRLERRISSVVGGQSAAVVSSWLALRDLVRSPPPEATEDSVVDLVNAVKNALGDDLSDILEETDAMLKILDIDDQAWSARPQLGPGLP